MELAGFLACSSTHSTSAHPWGSWLCCLDNKTLFHSCSLSSGPENNSSLVWGSLVGLPVVDVELCVPGWREDFCMWPWLSVPSLPPCPRGEAQGSLWWGSSSATFSIICPGTAGDTQNTLWLADVDSLSVKHRLPKERFKDKKEGENNISGICPLSTPCTLPELSFKALYMSLAASWEQEQQLGCDILQCWGCASSRAVQDRRSWAFQAWLSPCSGWAHSGKEQLLYKERCLCGCRLGELMQSSLLSWQVWCCWRYWAVISLKCHRYQMTTLH